MMTSVLIVIAIVLGISMPTPLHAFSSPRMLRGRCLGRRVYHVILSSGNDIDDEDFDPFLSSPHSFGSDADADDRNGGSVEISSASGTTFGFLSYESTTFASIRETVEESSSPSDFAFDPLLSPHAYVNGSDAAPVVDTTLQSRPTSNTAGLFSALTTQIKLGILLIDHGSKRQASNEHIHNVARIYEDRLNRKKNEGDDIVAGGGARGVGGSNAIATTTTTVVRAAHMEISKPSIVDSLRDIIIEDKVEKVVCVPYFLSPGRHATEDVPNLIAEARGALVGEGLFADIVVSNALGTHLESMMGAVDNLVELALSEEEGGFL